ncbi:MAG: diguanylate cyclase [Dokdonella sp.]
MGTRYVTVPFIAICVASLLAATFAHWACADAGLGKPIFGIAQLGADSEVEPAAVISGRSDSLFAPLAGDAITTSVRSDRWFRVELGTDWRADSAPVLSITDAAYTRVSLYAPPDWQEHLLWHAATDADTRYSRRALVFALPLDTRARQPIYVRFAKTNITLHPHITIADGADYAASDLNYLRLSTLFSAVQFTMILVALFLWFALGDRAFAWFVGYTSMQLIYLLLMSGELYALPGGRLFSLGGIKAPQLFVALSVSLALSFILEFCDLRTVTPRLAGAVSALRWPFIAAAAIQMLTVGSVNRYMSGVINLLLLLTLLTAIITVLIAAWRGNRASRFFLVAWVPQVAFLALRTTQLLLGAPQPAWLEYGLPFSMAFASIVVTLGAVDATLHARRERDIAHRAAELDGLTGALNRRALLARLTDAIAAAHAKAKPLALLFLDLDHFKSINDQRGHRAGDLCLQAVAKATSEGLTAGQTFGRYGGEEFLVILPESTPAQALAVGEQLRRHIECLRIDLQDEGVPLYMTASIGIANLSGSDDTPQQLIDRADHALYRAKAQGRNRVDSHAPLAVVGT